MAIPTPEEVQFLLGLHPQQVQAAQALAAAAQGGAQPGNAQIPPPDETPPRADQPAKPVSVVSPGLLPTPKPLDVPPVATPYTKDSSGLMVPRSSTTASPEPVVGAVPGAPQSGVSDLMTQPVPPLSAEQARENADREELDRLRTTGSGDTQFGKRHHFWGPIVRGLDIAGSVMFPRIAQEIPGTELHHEQLVNEAQGRVKQDVADEKTKAEIANQQALGASREEAAAIAQRKLDAANQKFVAGSEHEDPNSPTGWSAQTVGGDWKPYTPAASYKETAGEKFDEIQQEREKEADRMGLRGNDRKFFLANGKLAEPGTTIHVPSAEKEHYDDVKEAFKKQYGHYPISTDDFDIFNRMLKGESASGSRANQKTFRDSAAVDKYSNDWYEKQRKEVLNEKAKVKSLNPDAEGDDEKLQAEYKRIEDEYAQRSGEFEKQKQKWYAQLKAGKPVTVDDSSDIPVAVSGNPGEAQPAKTSPEQQAKPAGTDIGPAPAGSREGRTGKLQDGTRVIVKGGRLVTQ